MSKVIIDLKNINKTYNLGTEREIQILNNINLKVEEGEFVVIVGESGSGKSTLMNIIGTLDRPTSGEYYFRGNDISMFNDKGLSSLRNKQIGFVFQSFCLISRMNAIKNVMLPMIYGKVKRKERLKRAKEKLCLVNMEEKIYNKPSELSGGQNQRVAIARALANDPSIILADEPTGALDQKTSKTIVSLLKRLNQEKGITIIIITHSHEVALEGDRVITVSDGKIIRDESQLEYAKITIV